MGKQIHHPSKGRITAGAAALPVAQNSSGKEAMKMIDLSTVKELRALRLPGMARELESQLEEPQRYKALSFEDRLALLVDAENVSRRKNTIQRRIHEARLSESQACVEAIEYYEDRELDKG